MAKFSSRVKRRFSKDSSRHRATRPKTFSSEEVANAWAKANNVTNYELENLRNEEASTKKIRIVLK